MPRPRSEAALSESTRNDSTPATIAMVTAIGTVLSSVRSSQEIGVTSGTGITTGSRFTAAGPNMLTSCSVLIMTGAVLSPITRRWACVTRSSSRATPPAVWVC